MAYNITGTVNTVFPTVEITTKGGEKMATRNIVINVIKFDRDTGEPSPDPTNTPKFTFIGEKARQLDNFIPGETVRIAFDIYGRSYERNGAPEFFTEARPFRIEKVTQMQQLQAPAQTQQTENFAREAVPGIPYQQTIPMEGAPEPTEGLVDDLPF